MFLKMQNGFTLMETVVSMSLMGLIGLGAMSVMKQNLFVQGKFKEYEKYLEIENMIRLTITRKGACGIREEGSEDPLTFANNQIPQKATDIANDSPPLPIDLYFTGFSGATNGKKTLKERLENNSINLKAMEIVFPDIIQPLPDGKHYVRAKIIAHLKKDLPNNEEQILPFLELDTAVRINQESGNVEVMDCGHDWDPDLVNTATSGSPPGTVDEGLNNSGLTPTSLEERRFCVIIDRGLRTATSDKTFAGMVFDPNPNPFKKWDKDTKKAQQTRFRCHLKRDTEGSSEWTLYEEAERDRGDGNGRYYCRAFCL